MGRLWHPLHGAIHGTAPRECPGTETCGCGGCCLCLKLHIQHILFAHLVNSSYFLPLAVATGLSWQCRDVTNPTHALSHQHTPSTHPITTLWTTLSTYPIIYPIATAFPPINCYYRAIKTVLWCHKSNTCLLTTGWCWCTVWSMKTCIFDILPDWSMPWLAIGILHCPVLIRIRILI